MRKALPVYRQNGRERILLQIYCKPDELTIDRIENIADTIRSSGFALNIGYQKHGAQIWFDYTEQGRRLAQCVQQAYEVCGHDTRFIESSTDRAVA